MLLEYVKKYMHYKNIWCKRIFEDNIGLRAICTITDNDVIGECRSYNIKGMLNKEIMEDKGECYKYEKYINKLKKK